MTQWQRPYRIIAQELHCPACGVGIYGITHVGECSFCSACRAMITLDFDEQRNPVLRYPTDQEETEWLANPRVLRVIAALASHHERHGSPHPNVNPPDDGKPPY